MRPELGDCNRESVHHALTGQLDQGHAAVKEHLDRSHVLHQIELIRGQRLPGIANQRAHHHPVRDFRVEQEGGGDVGHRRNGRHIEGALR